MHDRRRKQSKYRRKLSLLVDAAEAGDDPNANLLMLANAARQSAAFGDVDFDAPYWTVNGLKGQAPSRSARQVILHFSRLPPDAPSRSPTRIPLQQGCETLAKAMIRLAHDADPLSESKARQILDAMHKLDAQLTAQERGIPDCTTADFETVVAVLEREGRTPESVNATKQGLAAIACVIDVYRLAPVPVDYVPSYYWAGNEVLSDEIVDSLLPTRAALEALDVLAEHVADLTVRGKVLAWVVILLFLAAFRISELLHIPLDCEVFADDDDLPLAETDWEQRPREVRYGLRYFNLKSRRDDVKWFATDDAPLARAIIARIRAVTAQGRQIAAEIARTGAPILPTTTASREFLTIGDVTAVLMSDDPHQARAWLRRHGIPVRKASVGKATLAEGLTAVPSFKRSERERADRIASYLKHSDAPTIEIESLRRIIGVRFPYRWLDARGVPVTPDTVSRKEVERALMKAHRATAADFPIALEEMLFVFPTRFFDSRCRPLEATASALTKDQLRLFLTGDKRTAGIFRILDLAEPDGSAIHLTPVMFRRHILTLAAAAGLPPEQQARLLNHRGVRALSRYALTKESTAIAESAGMLDGLRAFRGRR
jgi:hypothetical protein